nr:uncharacterized protein [Tanacetum cinerariifolium]
DVTMPFELHMDASDFAIGGVLMQDGHPIAFENRKLNETERKYTVQEKEMTPVVHCLRILRHYLLGSRFVIKTDNIATSYFQTQKKLSPKQARWQDFLAEFDYQLEYKPGKANVSEGSGSIIVVVDRFLKYGTFIAAPPDVTADDTAKLFFKNVVKYWGVPHVIVSDRDPRFTGRFWTELFKIMGTDLNFSTSFHLQIDGQTERVNALLELYLRHY